MRTSLLHTWVFLAVAALAVLVSTGLGLRDLVRDGAATCPASLVVDETPRRIVGTRTVVPMTPTGPRGEHVAPDGRVAPRSFDLSFREESRAYPPRYEHVQVLWREPAGPRGGALTCGAIAVSLRRGGHPWALSLVRDGTSDHYVLEHPGDDEAAVSFTIDTARPHAALQKDLLLTRARLPLVVALVALFGLAVGLVRSRGARAYALRIHAWTEAYVGADHRILDHEGGSPVATLEQTRLWSLRPGPVLVDPDVLAGAGGSYRGMPIVPRRAVALRDHAYWARATLVQLRDARAISVLSAIAALLALAAHHVA